MPVYDSTQFEGREGMSPPKDVEQYRSRGIADSETWQAGTMFH